MIMSRRVGEKCRNKRKVASFRLIRYICHSEKLNIRVIALYQRLKQFILTWLAVLGTQLSNP